jgi:hypothetical protein
LLVKYILGHFKIIPTITARRFVAEGCQKRKDFLVISMPDHIRVLNFPEDLVMKTAGFTLT